MQLYLRFNSSKVLLVFLPSIMFTHSSLIYAGDQAPSSLPQYNPTFHINVHTSAVNTNDQKTQVSQTSDLKSTQAQTQHVTPPVQPTFKDHVNTWWQTTCSYKYYIMGGSIIAGYGYLLGSVLADHLYIKRTDTWASWKSSIKLDNLRSMQTPKLINDLIHDIQTDYINMPDPTNASAPLAQFLNTIEYEIKRITNYIKYSTFLQRTKLLYVFPTNAATIKLAREKLQRAQFIKQLFVSWATDYKMHRQLQLP